MQVTLKCLLVSAVLIGFYICIYCCFGNVFTDDIKFSGGQNAIKRVKKEHGFLTGFFYTPFIGKIKKVHYVFFLANMVTFAVFLIAVNVNMWVNSDCCALLTRLSVIAFIATSCGAIWPRWKHYRWNMVRRRK